MLKLARVPVSSKSVAPEVCIIELGGTIEGMPALPAIEVTEEKPGPDHELEEELETVHTLA